MTTNRVDVLNQVQTSETDTSLRLAPDGAGGVEFASAGSGSLEVKEVDGSPDVSSVTIIRVSNGTLTDDGGGQVTIDTSGSGSLDVTDGITTVSPTSLLDFTSGAVVTDLGGGTAGVAVSGGGGTVQYPALKPGTPTYDFAGASLDGAFSAHSSGGSFVTADCMTQGIDWMGSAVELQFSGQFGILTLAHANTDLDFAWGGVILHGNFEEPSSSELMYGIAAIDSSGTGVGVVSYTSDENGYFATISTYGYNTFSDSWVRGAGGPVFATNAPMWFRLKRISGTWTGYMSKSGRVWDKTFSTRADSITVDRIAFGLWFDGSKVYSGRLTADYCQVDT